MKFNLPSFVTLSFITAFTIFIVNAFDLNSSSIQNERLLINPTEIVPPQTIIKVTHLE